PTSGCEGWSPAWSACSPRAPPHRRREVIPETASPAGEGARTPGDMLAGMRADIAPTSRRHGAWEVAVPAEGHAVPGVEVVGFRDRSGGRFEERILPGPAI